MNLLLVSALCFLVCLSINELSMYWDIQTENDKLKEAVVRVPKTDTDIDGKKNITAEGYLDPNDPFNRSLDWDRLHSVNPDIIGWLYIPDTVIDYPILQGSTDEAYLHKDYQGNYSYAGSIFTFAGADLVADHHVCIFGHNMASRQMFGSLRDYQDQEWAKEHRRIYLYTPERTKECTLVSVFKCDKADSIYELNKASKYSDENMALGERILARSAYDTGADSADGQIFTLSTCSGVSGGTVRLTVNFGVMKEKYNIEEITAAG